MSDRLKIAADCGSSGYRALYNAGGHKLALIFDEIAFREVVQCDECAVGRETVHKLRSDLNALRNERDSARRKLDHIAQLARAPR